MTDSSAVEDAFAAGVALAHLAADDCARRHLAEAFGLGLLAGQEVGDGEPVSGEMLEAARVLSRRRGLSIVR